MEWEFLHPDLLSLIFSYLSLSDHIRSALVCRQWRQIAAKVHHRRPQLPWLIKQQRQSTLEHQFLSAYSLPDKRYYNLNLPQLCDDRYLWLTVGSYEDWLVLIARNGINNNRSLNYVLYNPFTTVQIKLPPINDIFSTHIFLSSSPQSADCVAARITYHCGSAVVGGNSFVLFCNVNQGVTASWGNPIPCGELSFFQDAIFYMESFYIINNHGDLYVVDTINSELSMVLPSPPESSLSKLLIGSEWESQSIECTKYTLMVSDGELLLFIRIIKPYLRDFVPVIVYKANFEIGTWQICNSLNGKCLFRKYSSIAGPSSNDIEGDCVYFNRDYSFSDFDSFRVSDKRWIRDCFDKSYGTSEFRTFFDERDQVFLVTPKLNFC